MWTNQRGNHTWVEVWDGAWHFTGAAEPSPEGLDRAWFTADAAKAVADDPSCAIWANTWRPAKDRFPLVWNPADRSVWAVNVTDRYTSGATSASPGMRSLRKWLSQSAEGRLEAIPPAPLTKDEAAAAIDLVWEQWRGRQSPGRAAEWKENLIILGDKKMRLLSRVFGPPPAGGRSLWISLHGGGGAPAVVNDSQWQNQVRLYEPPEGVYVAPRAPTNNWNLWHEGHIDDFFDRLIEDHVLLAGVNPDKVYLMGYSAGGDGVYQIAPRMADRFAAASMMAGHPNDASPLGLRNLPFAIFSGAEDSAYNRNKVAAEWGAKLDALARQDPGGYPHRLTIYPGLSHWMNRKDAEAVLWMARLTRDPWPKKVVWHQSSRLHDRFYWLALPAGVARPGLTIRAEVEKNVVTVDAPGVSMLVLRLHDRLVDLDQPVRVRLNGKTVFDGRVSRQADAILKSLQQRSDPQIAATALLEVTER
jgi:poly(3-hydroxybutyrate) depolymerase